MHTHGINMHTYMHTCGVNRCAWVHICEENSRAFEAKMRVRKLISPFLGGFGVFVMDDRVLYMWMQVIIWDDVNPLEREGLGPTEGGREG
jgi:hypothetical protein